MKYYVILSCVVLLFSSCSNNNEKQSDHDVFGAALEEYYANDSWRCYLESMSRATGDNEKWKLTTAFLREHCDVTDDFATHVKKAICSDGFNAAFYASVWPSIFPTILKYVTLPERNLWLLAKDYDDESRLLMHETIQTERGSIRLYMTPELSPSEVSRKWIQLMTGQTFADRAECEAWLTQHKGKFHWNKEQGRFYIYENPATMPSTLPVADE